MKKAPASSGSWRRGAALLLACAMTLAWLAAAAMPSARGASNSAATITGSFGASCRDFMTHATTVGSTRGKDISHVVIHYADGHVVKDETIDSPDFSVDGGPGAEIDSATVKSGTTSETFVCQRSNDPPTAVLEVNTPESCFTWSDGKVDCDGTAARTAWTQSKVPTVGYGLVAFACGWPNDPACVQHEMPCGQKDFYSICRITYTFRGTSSTTPDDDIVSWSIDFGDGTSTGGNWITNPPTEVSHEYLIHYCPTCTRDPATLTVTDSAGRTHSNAQFVFHQYPD